MTMHSTILSNITWHQLNTLGSHFLVVNFLLPLFYYITIYIQYTFKKGELFNFINLCRR